MATSPKRNNDGSEQQNGTSDLLTGIEFQNICDITMPEFPDTDDTFIDSTGIDYLIKHTELNSKDNHIDRSKESLFIKFDPLYTERNQSNPASIQSESTADSNECDIGYETGSTMSALTDNYIAPPKPSVSTESMQSPTVVKDKPTQLVTPVISPSTPALTQSMSAILTPTRVITDRLVNITGNTPPIAAPRSPPYNQFIVQKTDHLNSLRIILQTRDQDILKLCQENRELKSSIQDTEYQYLGIIEDLESQLKQSSDEKISMSEREIKLVQQLNDRALNNKKMGIVMEKYEQTISLLIKEQQQKGIEFHDAQVKLTAERDQAFNHVAIMETSLNDLLAKYEKCKKLILERTEREKVYKEKIDEYEIGITKYKMLYNDLKKNTSETLSNVNATLDKINTSHNTEVTKLNTAIKKHEITISSLKESLAQKTKEKEELSKICDQFINGVH